MIKPGSICYLVNMPAETAEMSGRLVTVIERGEPRYAEWRVDAPWFSGHWFLGTGRSIYTDGKYLRPINDPDEPVATHTPEALTA